MRVRKTVLAILICFLAAVVLQGSAVSCEAQAAEAETTESTEAADTQPADVAYDLGTGTLRVEGTQDYLDLQIPEAVLKARVLEVQDNDFTLNAYLPVLRDAGWDLQRDLPGYIDRTDKSIHFIRQYLKEHAPSVYSTIFEEKRVDIKIDRIAFCYQTEPERVELDLSIYPTHREFLYILSLIDSDAVGWEQIGYAWYVGTCIDPCSELLLTAKLDPKMPYYQSCIDFGVDPAQITISYFRLMYDAIARVCFDRGLTHWGSTCESEPVTAEPVFSRKNADPAAAGDEKLSAFMAVSFLGWLDDQYGFEEVSRFCFGQKSFEEAFGTDFDSAFDQWKEWIIQK